VSSHDHFTGFEIVPESSLVKIGLFSKDRPEGEKYRNRCSRTAVAGASIQSNAAPVFLHDAAANP
jgi:hypothetical protein